MAARWSVRAFVFVFSAVALGASASCSTAPDQRPTGPSSIGSGQRGINELEGVTTSLDPGVFDVVELTKVVSTTTFRTDQQQVSGRIQFQILVDPNNGKPLPCGSANGVWEQIDGTANGISFNQGSVAGVVLELDEFNSVNPNVRNLHCDQTYCLRAEYFPEGDFPVVPHVSPPLALNTGGCLGCATQDYWQAGAAWPVSGLTLGTQDYSKAQLLSILVAPVRGNGLVSLAQQLIIAKLNILDGVDGASIASTIAAADTLIGSQVVPPLGSGSLKQNQVAALENALEDFNDCD